MKEAWPVESLCAACKQLWPIQASPLTTAVPLKNFCMSYCVLGSVIPPTADTSYGAACRGSAAGAGLPSGLPLHVERAAVGAYYVHGAVHAGAACCASAVCWAAAPGCAHIHGQPGMPLTCSLVHAACRAR